MNALAMIARCAARQHYDTIPPPDIPETRVRHDERPAVQEFVAPTDTGVPGVVPLREDWSAWT